MGMLVDGVKSMVVAPVGSSVVAPDSQIEPLYPALWSNPHITFEVEPQVEELVSGRPDYSSFINPTSRVCVTLTI